MNYHVINKRTYEEKTLKHEEINDVETDEFGRILVFGTDREVYFLLADSGMIAD